MSPRVDELRAAFLDRFGAAPRWVLRAPGRVNLIGEHTDYNDSFVLPMAIDRGVWLAARPLDEPVVRLSSLQQDRACEVSLLEFERGGPPWGEYLRGVAWALRRAGLPLRGWEGVLLSDLPVGAGLSSSAALELACARAFAAAAEFPWEPLAMARLAQAAESEWVGVHCGIMDQMIVAAGQAGAALLVDCRSLAFEPVPIPAACAVVVLDTATRRRLGESAYNLRRAECQRAAAHYGVSALRDLDLARLEADATGLDSDALRRARHVVTETGRTLAAAAALRGGDAQGFAALLDEGHRSLRDDFQVSCSSLDAMVAAARGAPGCLGARMTGAGFGGCALALVQVAAVPDFLAQTAQIYRRSTGLEPSLYVCRASAGVALI